MGEHIKVERDGDGIAVVTWDMDGKSANMLTDDSMSEFTAKMTALLEDDEVKGIVIASAKDQFHVGFDLETALKMRELTREEIFDEVMRGNHFFRKMETSNKPVVAAIEGHCMGGGFEMVLACHARIVADDPKIKMGLPETKVGLIPGFGGSQRLPRLMPLDQVVPMIAAGNDLRPAAALKVGAITEVVAKGETVERAKAWARENPKAAQPWDQKKFRLPSGDFYSAKNVQFFVGASGNLRKNTRGNYPAPQAAAECIYHGLQMPIDQALKLEARRFVNIIKTREAEVMIRSLFHGLNEANGLKRRPSGIETRQFPKIGMVGAGLMGAGIAYVSAKAGIEVVLLDREQEAADKGKAYSERLVEKDRKRGRMDEAKGQALLGRIHATTDYAALADCGLVIEAVFESAEIKKAVFEQIEAVVADDAVIASNTSTIPITQLAQHVQKPERFIGMHFFSPVEKMPLIEIISGEQTSKEALAYAFDACKAMRKTPIDVNDGRGFYTTRVCSAYFSEGMTMLMEGLSPALIDNVGLNAGMPMGPLRLGDMVNLDLAVKIADQYKADLGEAYVEEPGITAARKMCDLGRLGEKAGKGFYDHEGRDAKLWEGLAEVFPPSDTQASPEEVAERLMVIQAIEMLRCMDEGVLKTPQDADIGSILGWGFAPFTGGVASYVDTLTPAGLLKTAKALEARHGKRFAPPKLLEDLAASGKLLYDNAA